MRTARLNTDHSIFQAIFHLSQVSAILTPRQTAYLSKKTAKKQQEQAQILCQDSFFETLKNCDFTFAKHLNTKTLFQNHYLNRFNISYISSNSFFENKHGFSEADLKSEAIPSLYIQNNKYRVSHGFYSKFLQSFLTKNQFVFNVQVRGFKTDRNIKAEKLRNPTLTSRLKYSLGS